jgi:hypothetical protein
MYDGGKFRHEWLAVAHVYLLSKRERERERSNAIKPSFLALVIIYGLLLKQLLK